MKLDFTTNIGKVDKNLIKKYQTILPEKLIQIWKEYGFGTREKNFIKIIHPDDYLELLNCLVLA